MCICAKPTHLSDTQIFTCVCGIEKETPTRQFVVYENKITFTDEGVSENLMCLPIPLKDGLVPKEHIYLYDFSQESKKGAVAKQYKDFFKNVDHGFKVISRSLSASPRSNAGTWSSDHLEVVQVGGYQCSLASSPADVLKLDPKVFGEPVGMREVLEKNYPHNFAFLIARFSRNGKKQLDLHPIAYSHPIASDGTLFIPTRHYHGAGKPNDVFVDDWDHNIYILGGDVGTVNAILQSAKYGRGLKKLDAPVNPFSKDAVSVLENAFSQHGKKDSFDVQALFSKANACKVHIKGTFDNLDFQPPALVARA